MWYDRNMTQTPDQDGANVKPTGAYVTVLSEDGTWTEYWLEASPNALRAIERTLDLWTVTSQRHYKDEMEWSNSRTTT